MRRVHSERIAANNARARTLACVQLLGVKIPDTNERARACEMLEHQ